MICFIHCAPVAGESGCIYSLPGWAGSAFPLTIHSESWNLYLQYYTVMLNPISSYTHKHSSTDQYVIDYLLSSTGTMSITTIYLASGSSPDMLICITGNILLRNQKGVDNSLQTELQCEKSLAHLPALVMIISVVALWNFIHRSRCSSVTVHPLEAVTSRCLFSLLNGLVLLLTAIPSALRTQQRS